MRIRYRGKLIRIHVDQKGTVVKNEHLWGFLKLLNTEGVNKVQVLRDLSFYFTPESEPLIAQSDFVIPDEMNYACVRCGGCCRNAENGCPIKKFLEPNICMDYEHRLGGCHRFPFRLFNAPPFKTLLLVSPYCQGVGKGKVVTKERYQEIVNGLLALDRQKADGRPMLILKTHFDRNQGRWVFDK